MNPAQQIAEETWNKVNRLEIIDHTTGGKGREYVKWAEKPFKVTLDQQDGGKTLKIFLDDIAIKPDEKTKEYIA